MGNEDLFLEFFKLKSKGNQELVLKVVVQNLRLSFNLWVTV